MARSRSPVHTPKEWPVSLALDPTLVARLEEEAKRLGRPIEDVIREAVRAFLEAHPVSLR
jgi:predicted transcriptional regulator